MVQDNGRSGADAPSGREPTASAASRLRKVVSLTQEYGIGLFRKLTPLVICAAGGAILAVDPQSIITLIIAFFAWAWALDLAAERSRTRTMKTVAKELWETLRDERTLTFAVEHTYRADDETLAAAQVIEARRAATPQSGAVHESAVGSEADDAPNLEGRTE